MKDASSSDEKNDISSEDEEDDEDSSSSDDDEVSVKEEGEVKQKEEKSKDNDNKDGEKKKKVKSNDVTEGKTVFLRNLPFHVDNNRYDIYPGIWKKRPSSIKDINNIFGTHCESLKLIPYLRVNI